MTPTTTEVLLRLGLAALVGMAIGLEREWREKAAGFRTITLVTIGAAVFVLLGGAAFSVTDRARVIAGVVTGIGFLGAGTILRERGQVVGLTTAATVWAACGLGLAAGVGAYLLAAVGTVLVLAVLILLPKVDVAEMSHDVRRFELSGAYSDERYRDWERRFTDVGLLARRRSLTRDGDGMTVVWDVSGSPDGQARAVRAFMDDPTVARVEVV